MARGLAITDELRMLVEKAIAKGTSNDAIRRIYKISKSSLWRIKNKVKGTPKQERKKPGPKGKLSKAQKLQVRRLLHKSPTLSAADVIGELGLNCCRRTITNELARTGWRNRKYRKAPLLSSSHRLKRLHFVESLLAKRADLTVILYTDEKRFSLDGPDGDKRVWINEIHQCHRPTRIRRQQGGGGVMAWVGFCGQLKTPLVFFDDSIDGETYLNHVKYVIKPWCEAKSVNIGAFQHDNATPHTDHRVTAELKRWNMEVLDWPPNSPDLNPVELVWAALSREVYKRGRQYTSKESLKSAIITAWENLRPSYLDSILTETWKRMVKVLKTHGGKSD